MVETHGRASLHDKIRVLSVIHLLKFVIHAHFDILNKIQAIYSHNFNYLPATKWETIVPEIHQQHRTLNSSSKWLKMRVME